MYRAARARIAIGLLAALPTIVLAARQAPRFGLTQRVPDAVIEAAEKPGTIGMIRSLALMSVPAGAILPERTDPRESYGRSKLESDLAPGLKSLDTAIDRFRENHEGVNVEAAYGHLLIAPETSACRPVLDRRVSLNMTNSAGRVFSELARLVNPLNPGGPVGYAGSGDSEYYRAQALVRTPVTVKLDRAPLGTAFGVVVRQVPGLVWALRELETPALDGSPCKLVLFTRGAAINTSWTLY